ncbi:hypothetical protein COCC4DRAFT_46719 [Bipolaris maydis ATCC 48331]|uniref:Uncharacterized protein n=2 Tax=Cochliobolus heterostrophus TaxID=5016 RepID=M2URU9_COCH5|nr:uncharacterized protein COCC4DRAFT_46719 [Bipolaris maydis ATCC 48331]EMD96296.1 hypothetical protein COCHEDRAFT_1127994 [Bipolaris maydis C5]KAH7562128.1 hypothetical protein BM1_03232 [Bipolaris maydis]ENI11156.1 hypothetical protein COCC4DRAFT_46719 [Bipolaris maydis ATCC 48331]KAJ5030950.1 hypothetical protein J3E73DRAFT_281270 [Bipolaris maydis]KAJ5065974.1 hypothetical protein J3E74DRAFT_306486 [Bipolaris maydis]
MVSFTTLLTLAAGALATPVTPVLTTRDMNIPANWTWHVSGWEAGCQRQGCYYNFNITIPSWRAAIGGGKYYCNGYENGWYRKGNWFEECKLLELAPGDFLSEANNTVAAKLSEQVGDDPTPNEIIVSFVWKGYTPTGRPSYNFSGEAPAVYNQFVSPPLEFDITPSDVFAVA